MDFRPPENFVRHPVTNSGKTILHEKNGLDRRFAMAAEKLINEFLIEVGGNDFGSVDLPPRCGVFAMVESHPAELARIGENQCRAI
ncbi:MAG: hypothetical protein QOH39_655 [Verrucomicrobiota bacterium]